MSLARQGYRETATYTYTLNGDPVLRSIRYEHPEKGKTFRQSSWDEGSQRWLPEVPDSCPRPLYRQDELANISSPFVVFVEGEKDADLLWSLGFPAVTSPMGAGKADKVSSWDCLANQNVVVIADNDPPGQKHAQQVAEILKPLVASLRVLTMPDVPPKGDVSDWFAAGGTPEAFRALLHECEPIPLGDSEVDAGRVFVERAFVCSAWDHGPTAQVLASFKTDRFKDHVSRSAAVAIEAMVSRNETEDLNPLSVALEMRKQGAYGHWTTLEEFHNQRLSSLSLARSATYKAFRESCCWDDAKAYVDQLQEELNKGDFQTWINAAHTRAAELLARSATSELKTLKDHCVEWLEQYIDGKTPERPGFRLAHLSDVIGEVYGGDVVVQIGAPKTGKSSVLLDQVVTAAEQGIKSLVGDLEMRMDQVVKRAVAKILRKPIKAVTPADAARLLESGQLEHLENIFYTSRCRSLDKYIAEVSSILARHRDIRLWATDYAECVQQFGNGANRVDESEAIAKRIKDTAVAFDVCAILLVQPNQKYTEEGARGPRTNHAKNSTKWEQDAQALVFIHSPARFFQDMPKEYIELHVLAGRDSDTGVIPLKWYPSTYSYERWQGPVPAGGGRTLAAQTKMDGYTKPAEPEFEEMDIPL